METNITTDVPQQPQKGVVEQKKDTAVNGKDTKKTYRNLRAGVILCAILAVIGVIFGVGAISHSIREKSYYENKINDLKENNDRLRTEYGTFYDTNSDDEKEEVPENSKNDDELADTDASYFIEGGSNGCDGSINADINPQGSLNRIVASNNPEERFTVHFHSSNVDNNYGLQIGLRDGDIEYCRILKKKYDVSGIGYTAREASECNIKGLDGKVFKIVEFYSGHDNGDANIGFIMADGRVRFLPLYSSVKNKDFQICGNVGINGAVADAFQISVGATDGSSGGYLSTVFVLNDGSQIKYDESMVK